MKLVWALSIVLVCAFISQASEDRTNIQDASFLSILIMFLFILIQTSATHIERAQAIVLRWPTATVSW